MSKKDVSKSWCFTSFDNKEAICKLLNDIKNDVSYWLYGKEVCKETNREHLQGMIIFKNAKRFTAVKKLLNCHVEKCKSINDSILYCKKEGTWFEHDNRQQGRRTDIKDVANIILNGSLCAAITAYPDMYIKYHAGMEKLSFSKSRVRDFKPTVIWLWGKSGVGKTRLVHEIEKDLWVSGETLKWWDGYNQQEATLFDDFREDQCDFVRLLRLIDRYSCSVQVKGGTRQLYSKRMYITSPFSPENCYLYLRNEEKNQLLRRLDIVTEVTEVEKGNTNFLNWKYRLMYGLVVCEFKINLINKK